MKPERSNNTPLTNGHVKYNMDENIINSNVRSNQVYSRIWNLSTFHTRFMGHKTINQLWTRLEKQIIWIIHQSKRQTKIYKRHHTLTEWIFTMKGHCGVKVLIDTHLLLQLVENKLDHNIVFHSQHLRNSLCDPRLQDIKFHAIHVDLSDKITKQQNNV